VADIFKLFFLLFMILWSFEFKGGCI